MNKGSRRPPAKRLTRDGLPVDAREWREEDWRDLHLLIEEAKRRIAARHKAEGEGDAESPRLRG